MFLIFHFTAVKTALTNVYTPTMDEITNKNVRGITAGNNR